MSLAKKWLSLFIAFVLLTTSWSDSIGVVAAAVSASKTTVLQNDFIKITVDNATGRFGVRTVDGQPIRKNDNNVDMMFRGDDPETSFTTFRIDGTDYIFGNPYKFGVNFFSETTAPRIVSLPNGTKQIESTWSIKGVTIKQILMLYMDAKDIKNAGNVNIRYEVTNNSGVDVQIGSRILLDTMVGSNDGPQFQIGTTYRSPLTVERRLVHDPAAIGIPEEDISFYKLPSYWVMRDQLDLNNPQATNVVAYGFNNFAEQNIHIVDEMVVAHWNSLANTKWDYEPNPNLDFTRDTNDFGTADSAVAFYWNPEKLAKSKTQTFETIYGLGEIIEPDKVFSIRYMDPVQQLATLPDNSGYVDEGVFKITAEIENLAMFDMTHRKVDVKLELESGLNFVRLDENGNIVRDADGKVVTDAYRSKVLTRQKPLTPEEAANGVESTYKPGDTFTVEFYVQAKGRPWPATRQYMLTASSEETEKKMEGVEDEGIKAQYQSVKSNFILLPPVGEAVPTYVYGLSPAELFRTDVKYITVNLSNIEAYNTGDQTTPPNFDLYLKEKVTGKRYKVPVQESVLMQPTDDGFSGDMRITYRGGDLVDSAGQVLQAGLGPELPLGEYQVQLDYKGDTGGDEEIAAMYDITTSQTFSVTNNEATRIREANIVALYKQSVDLTLQSGDTINPKLAGELNSLYTGASFTDGKALSAQIASFKKAVAYIGKRSNFVDPKLDIEDWIDEDSLKKVPIYQYKLFSSEAELKAFFSDSNYKRENLVTIRGMVKEIGTGADQQVVVDTSTEPAIINDAVAYKGKNLVFVRGKLDVFNVKNEVPQYASMPFFDTLFIKGEGTLSVASSGFVFHEGEWTLDFFDGFNKSLGTSYQVSDDEVPDSEGNEEDDSLNGSLAWAAGQITDRLNPLRQITLRTVYFNRQSLFAPPSFTIAGFGFNFNEFILRSGGVSFGGTLLLKVVEAEVNNVIFNKKGFVGVDASLDFALKQNLGLFAPTGNTKKAGKDDDDSMNKITVVHYVQPVEGVNNKYGIAFEADMKEIGLSMELAFKKVDDGRILPDVIGFGAEFEKGILLTGATYLTGIRGAVRELADTIAGGSKKDPFPLTVEAGVSLKFGVAPAFFWGDIDLTLKRTGIKIEGAMDFSVDPEPEEDELLPMLTYAVLEAQWVTPWFVRLQSEIDIGGWDIIIGKSGIFVGQNLEKNRIDFEGYIGAKVQVPSNVPVVGGMPLASVFFGVNNDKIWGSVSVLLISLGVTYYWGGGLEFGTAGNKMPEGFVNLLVEDPEKGPRLVVIGEGMETLATSWIDTEQDVQETVYRSVADGVKMIENGNANIGVGGITVKNGGRVHTIPMGSVSGNAIVEVEYESQQVPNFTLKDGSGKNYPIVFDNTNTNPNANAFTQHVSASESSDQVDVRKAYVIVPQSKATGNWTLTSESAVETRLINVPTTPDLTETKLTKDASDSNKFTASWKVANAKPGDTVSLYLTKDAVSNNTSKTESGETVLQPGDPGLLIAKDLQVGTGGGVSGTVTSGKTDIDVSKVQLLGAEEDIRGLLSQGNYYLRAELHSASSFGTKTSAERIELIDPLAPAKVSDVTITPDGNGLFSLSFKPGARKASQAGYEHSYAIEALTQVGGSLQTYPNFGEVLFTEEELAPYWNAQTGKYEGILLGGWNATSTSQEVNTDSLAGSTVASDDIKYTGLEVGKEYVLGVSAVTKPDKTADKNENYHFATRVDSAKKLLPVPAKPKLNAAAGSQVKVLPHYMELLTSATEQTINLTSDQKDIEVEAFYGDTSIGKKAFTNQATGSKGTLTFNQFDTDGPYAIELRARNTKTGDVSVTMLYLTVDTIKPVLYIDEPVTGARSGTNGIKVKGTTSVDVASLKVNGQSVAVTDDGTFEGMVTVAGNTPTSELNFIVLDKAGNENTAVVQVTNGTFDVPSGVVLETIPNLKPGDSSTLKASLKYADGKDASGHPKFKLVPVADLSKLSYSVSIGDAVQLSSTGKVTGVTTGASLIEAEYQISSDVSVKGMVVATVEVPEPTAIGKMTASTSTVSGDSGKTKLNVVLPQDTTGQQLVYKKYPAGTKPADVTLKQDLSDWSFVPTSYEVAAAAGETVVVALRSSLTKEAWSASAALKPALWTEVAAGGGSVGIPGVGIVIPEPSGEGETPSEPAKLNVNGKPITSQWKGKTVVARVTEAEVDLASAANEIKIAVQSAPSAQGYAITLDAALVAKANESGKTVKFDLQGMKLDVTPEMMKNLNGDLIVQAAANDDSAKAKLKAVADGLGAAALGDGEGIAVDTNLPAEAWNRYVNAQVTVPGGIDADDITAVVLEGTDGSWTTLPWSLALDNGQPAVNLQLTGEGNLVFMHNEASFSDISAGHWGAEVIQGAAGKLFMLGKSGGKFDPEANVTRAEYPTVLLRVAGLMNRTSSSSYTDVPENAWYGKSVAIASELGIINGRADGSYAPSAPMSRLEGMVMTGRMLDAAGLGGPISESEANEILARFEDASAIPAWARAAVAMTVKSGLIQGVQGRIDPQGQLQRVQASAIAMRFDQLITNQQEN
ncbi:hypothetical protein FHS18_006034 [Paenibacillus phyllosphaerae]|uniref:SLH domain-containing protein n=1 Tax=Paenibacillus phyllosphaerae TaxID=274593 RepID=A0A7W5B4B1_9BACL|nr:S-layer homology domain-containing protein [Paenibacillus phyllosphaerae]MBB3113919.1 hypothetical protein [Paenibacillus phyllosphaerae]